MRNKHPLNILKSKKKERETIESTEFDLNFSNLVPMNVYKSSYNKTKPFYKPISKLL